MSIYDAEKNEKKKYLGIHLGIAKEKHVFARKNKLVLN